MIRAEQHLAVGLIAPRSGAAVAALKARALAWEAPIRETPEGLRLFVWGAELRLLAEPQGWRIELAAPEARLIGTLRDSTTELFGEIGLNVAWDHVDVGALAPGLSLMRVTGVRPLTPGFLRVRVAGPEAARFATGSLHFRLLLPRRGYPPLWPRVGASGRTIWPEDPGALHRPVYTVAAQAGDWLDFDIFRHAGSPTCDWAMSDPVGDQVGILGPGGGWCPMVPRLHLFGDETAMPASRACWRWRRARSARRWLAPPMIWARWPAIPVSAAAMICWRRCARWRRSEIWITSGSRVRPNRPGRRVSICWGWACRGKALPPPPIGVRPQAPHRCRPARSVPRGCPVRQCGPDP